MKRPIDVLATALMAAAINGCSKAGRDLCEDVVKRKQDANAMMASECAKHPQMNWKHVTTTEFATALGDQASADSDFSKNGCKEYGFAEPLTYKP